MSLPNLPVDLVIRCISPLLTEGPASNREQRVSAVMVVFKTCKRMSAMLRYMAWPSLPPTTHPCPSGGLLGLFAWGGEWK